MPTPRVGLAYSRAAAGLAGALAAEVDYLEFPYELLVHDDTALALATGRPAVLHCASLSLASGLAPAERVESVVRMAGAIASPWVGEHLSLVSASVPDDGSPAEEVYDIGFAVSPPLNEDTLETVVAGLAQATAACPVPVLVENAPIYLDMPASTMTQGRLVTEVLARSGAYLLLDIAHFRITCNTYGLDPHSELENYPLERVREIHLSGVADRAGVWWDDHDGVPDEVQYDLPRAGPRRRPGRGGHPRVQLDATVPARRRPAGAGPDASAGRTRLGVSTTEHANAVVARALVDPDFLARLTRTPEAAFDEMRVPADARPALRDLDAARLGLVSGYVCMVKHNHLWEEMPATRLRLREDGSDLAVFTAYATARTFARGAGRPTAAEFAAYLAEHAAEFGPDGERVADLARHEAVLVRLASAEATDEVRAIPARAGGAPPRRPGRAAALPLRPRGRERGRRPDLLLLLAPPRG